MTECKEKLPLQNKPGDVAMQADIIDQVNTNQQSNMALSNCTVITQTESMIKLNVS